MCRDHSSDVVTATAWWKQPVPEEYTALNDEGIPLHVDWWGQNFRNIRSPLSCGGHDGFTLRLELVNKIVHLFPFSPQFQSLTGSTWSEQKQTRCPISLISPLCNHNKIFPYKLELYLTGAAVILGFSGSMMVSVMMVPEDTLVMPALPNPPKAGTFFPERSASLLACCSSLAFLLISALASRSWVCRITKESEQGSEQHAQR